MQCSKDLFFQQKLAGLRPFVSAKMSIVVNFLLFLLFLALGIIACILDSSIFSYKVRYDEACTVNSTCTISIPVTKTVTGTIYLQYELTKYYQNNRRFSYSRSDDQLSGEYVSYSSMSACSPYRSVGDVNNASLYYLPCGLYALSVFNDTFSWDNSSNIFNESKILYSNENGTLFNTISSQYTSGNRWLDNNSVFSNGILNPHFMVWMRISALATVVKPYAICTDCTLYPGTYNVTIVDNFPTTQFSGYKYLVLSQKTSIGFSTMNLGIILIVISVILFAWSSTLLISVLFFKRPGVNDEEEDLLPIASKEG